MLLLMVLSIVAVGAGVGLQSVVKVPEQTDATLAINSALVSTMEQLKTNLKSSWPTSTFTATINVNGTSCPVSLTLGSTTGYSKTITVNNGSYTLTITMAQANPDGSGTKSDFLQVTSTIGTQSMTTFVTQM